ncbi:MAG: hypothetical protein ACPG40_00210 [Alphaproteobacteria bacterium]
MKKFLIAGSSLAAVAAAGSAGAVDVTLGGSIDMGVEYGVGKAAGEFAIGDAYNKVSLKISAAGTTDGGLKYGGSFGLGTDAELSFAPYENGGKKYLVKATQSGPTDIIGNIRAVSGGATVGGASGGDIVAVKINSDWQSVGATVTGYSVTPSALAAATICKVAGRATPAPSLTVTRMTANGAANTGSAVAMTAAGYLPAGHVTGGSATLSAGGAVVNATGVDMDGTGTGAALTGDVYAGPFMSVMLRSSSTKMVVGAVCVEGIDASGTNFFLDNASKVVTASDASIFVEGGFGKITLQTGDYAGGVSAIGDAGDAADLDTDGLAVIMSGVGLLGANPFVAIDLAPASAPANLEILTGGTIDMGGLSAAIDVALSSSDVVDILSWDLGLDYALGDMAVAFAYDSNNDWGMSASMDVAGFGVDATVYSKSTEDHAKNGLFYSIAASTSLNGFVGC